MTDKLVLDTKVFYTENGLTDPDDAESGAFDVMLLADYLNGGPWEEFITARGRARLRMLVLTLKSAVDLASQGRSDEASEQLKLSESMSKRYKRPRETFALSDKGELYIDSVFPARYDDRQALEEFQLFRSIQLVIEKGMFERLRNCEHCGRFIFARHGMTKFCSPTCRDQFKTKSDSFQEKRRAYMRRYYKLRKSGKVRI